MYLPTHYEFPSNHYLSHILQSYYPATSKILELRHREDKKGGKTVKHQNIKLMDCVILI